jgi:hypothetical protein
MVAPPGYPATHLPVPSSNRPEHGKASKWSVPWALVPLLSLGFLTPLTIGHAAWRLRSKVLAASAALYTVAVVVVTILSDSYPDGVMPGAADVLMGICLLGSWLGGTANAFVLRRRVFPLRLPNAGANRAAIQEVAFRRELRARSQEIARKDPVLARELRIGRPDLPRTYDDGGLVNVNYASTNVLVGLPGVTPAIATQIVEVRDKRGPFVSAEDVAAIVNLEPQIVPQFADYTVYIV